ncbi:hypothetical protein HDE_09129 [Halotydeus destructor]|nr:hypothetical protein HDE_09129 [Halotydeus destructor]
MEAIVTSSPGTPPVTTTTTVPGHGASIGSSSPRSSKAPSPASSPVSLMSPHTSSHGSPRPSSASRTGHSGHPPQMPSPPLDIVGMNGHQLDSPPLSMASNPLMSPHYTMPPARGHMGPTPNMASFMCSPSAMKSVFPSLYSPMTAKEASGFNHLTSGLNSYMCSNPLTAFYGSAFGQASQAYAQSLFNRSPSTATQAHMGHPYAAMSLLNNSLSRNWLTGHSRPRSPPSTAHQYVGGQRQSTGCPPVPTSLAHHHHHRAPGDPLTCPLCGVSLDGQDVAGHFYEEVHKMETLRKLNDWENSKESNELKRSADSDPDSEPDPKRRFLGDNKMQPCTRWQTYQRVRSNRSTRLSGFLRCNKRFQADQMDCKSDMSKSPLGSPSSLTGLAAMGAGNGGHLGPSLTTRAPHGSQRIWSIVGDIQVHPT